MNSTDDQGLPQDESQYDENREGKDNLEQENKVLRETIFQLKMELDRYRSPALMLAEVLDVYEEHAIIRVPNGNKFYVNISKDVEGLEPGDTVNVEQKNLTIVEKIKQERNLDVDKFVIIDKPNVKWKDIGGLRDQEKEIKEVVELPLKKPKLFKEVGINPPKGILLHGPPGTGKTLLAKAVASSTKSTFIEIVGSELVQKFIGEGAKLVKEVFKMAKENAPAVIFIDELDAIAAQRVEVGTSGEREVQRTFMQFLAELDGFEPLDNVKVIGCTNRKDILDPAILRPGRLDRLVEVPNPSKEGLKEVFKIHTRNMSVDNSVNFEKIYKQSEGLSGAQIQSICTEAGYFAIRKNRKTVHNKDFEDAIKKVTKPEEGEGSFAEMYG